MSEFKQQRLIQGHVIDNQTLGQGVAKKRAYVRKDELTLGLCLMDDKDRQGQVPVTRGWLSRSTSERHQP